MILVRAGQRCGSRAALLEEPVSDERLPLEFATNPGIPFRIPRRPGLPILAPLHVQNGTDTDGTPVIKRLHVLLDLESQGLVELNVRVPGVNPEPWVV